MTVRPSTSIASSEIAETKPSRATTAATRAVTPTRSGVDGEDLREKGGAAQHRNGATVIGRSGRAV